MNDMCWPLLPCCCVALLSWSATTRRAQQRVHRCNFGELDKLPFYEENHPQTRIPCWSRFNARTSVRVCLSVKLGCVWRWEYFISLFPSCLSPGRWQCFWSRRWARLRCLAGEDKGVESRPAVPLCQSDQNEIPVSPFPIKITLWTNVF